MKRNRIHIKQKIGVLLGAFVVMAGIAGASSTTTTTTEKATKKAAAVTTNVKHTAATKADAKAVQATVSVQKATPHQDAQPTKALEKKESTEPKIGINLASRILILYQGNKKVAMYPIGVGKVSTPTPTGYYRVQTKEVNPTWVNPDDTSIQIQSGPENPLGYRWIGFSGTYGIHGTNRPDSVGYYVSNGCIRMHENDVESIYNKVAIGTPVNVYYDRIVIDSSADHTVSYYIYPDGYGWQPLSVQHVKKALHGYGVEDFADGASIYSKIAASDGQPTYVAKAYDLIVNGTKLSKRALKKNGTIYLPAVAVATALKMDLHWSGKQQLLTSPYGKASGVAKSDVIYVNATDAGNLFHANGKLTAELTYVMTSLKAEKTAAAAETMVTISKTEKPKK